MGYYTRFTINIENEDKNIPSIITELAEAIEKQSDYDFDNDGSEIWSDESIKWYDNNEDMVEVSKAFPDLVIQVDGEGEESGDIWRTYWKDGKTQKAKRVVTVEDYDETKLS